MCLNISFTFQFSENLILGKVNRLIVYVALFDLGKNELINFRQKFPSTFLISCLKNIQQECQEGISWPKDLWTTLKLMKNVKKSILIVLRSMWSSSTSWFRQSNNVFLFASSKSLLWFSSDLKYFWFHTISNNREPRWSPEIWK